MPLREWHVCPLPVLLNIVTATMALGNACLEKKLTSHDISLQLMNKVYRIVAFH